jgi:hypothetical protein
VKHHEAALLDFEELLRVNQNPRVTYLIHINGARRPIRVVASIAPKERFFT